MPTMEVSYGQPSGYYSGSSPASKTVSRLDYAGYPEDSYTNYKVTSYYAEWEAQVYISAGATADFECNGASFSKSMDEAQSTETFTKSGSSLSNKILDKWNTGTMEVDISRDGGSGTGNVALFKSGIYLRVEYEYAYTACGAPSSVTVGTSTPAAGGSTTLSWSGASAGTLNPITKYEIYRATSATGTYSLLDTVTTSSTSGSLKVTAPSSMGSSYYYKVKTIGTVSGYDSGYSGYVGITAKTITKCSAPTAVSLSPTAIDKGGSTTLTWSGAKAGTNNAITAYQIYRSTDNSSFTLDQTYQTSATSGSLKLTLSPSADTTYYYKIITVGSVSGYNSGYSSVASVAVATYTACGNITARVEANIAEGAVKVSWTKSADGHNNPVSAYQVQYQDSADGNTWGATTNLTSLAAATLEYSAALNGTRGCYRRYLITPIGTKAGLNGAVATTGAVKTNQLPAAPTILAPRGQKTTHNEKPYIKYSIAAEPDGQPLHIQLAIDDGEFADAATVAATGGSFVLQLPTVTAGSHTFKLRASDLLANGEESETITFTYNKPPYDDADTAKGSHITQLRNQANTLEYYYGLTPTIWNGSTFAGQLIYASHITQLQEALIKIAQESGQKPSFTAVKRNDLIKKKVVTELRNAITGG